MPLLSTGLTSAPASATRFALRFRREGRVSPNDEVVHKRRCGPDIRVALLSW